MPSYQQMQRALYIKRALTILPFLIVTLGLYFFLQSDSWSSFSGWLTRLGKPEINHAENEQNTDIDDFESMLTRSNSQQLILFSTELVDSPDLTILHRLDVQQKRVRIANRVVELNENDRAVQFGIASKLAAIRTRESINQEAGLSTLESVEELRLLANQHISSNDDSVFREANLGSVVADILTEFLNLQDRGPISKELLQKFSSICKQFNNDEIVGRELFRFVNLIRKRASTASFMSFASEYSTAFSSSHKSQLKAMAANLEGQMSNDKLDLVDIFDSIDSLRPQAIQKKGQMAS